MPGIAGKWPGPIPPLDRDPQVAHWAGTSGSLLASVEETDQLACTELPSEHQTTFTNSMPGCVRDHPCMGSTVQNVVPACIRDE